MRARVAACVLGAAAVAACGGTEVSSGASSTSGSAATVTPAPATASTSSTSSATGRGGEREGGVAVPPAGSAPQPGHPWFLAIGDSITSGYTVDPARSGRNSAWVVQLQQLLSRRGESWTLYDVACAGETLESYATRCHDRNVETAVLHGGTQRQAALDAIAGHRADLRLIAVDLGSNDLLQALSAGTTVQAAAASVSTRLEAIVAELQAAAPAVPVIICNYYNPIENLVAASEGELAQINAAVARVAAERGARLADFHAAINTDHPPDNDLCTWVDCIHLDVHPTIAGHARLAAAALAVIR